MKLQTYSRGWRSNGKLLAYKETIPMQEMLEDIYGKSSKLSLSFLQRNEPMGMRLCTCCQKWWDVELPKRPGVYRKKDNRKFIDSGYHEFVVWSPPIRSWKRRKRYCIVCNKVHDFVQMPRTGEWRSNLCD